MPREGSHSLFERDAELSALTAAANVAAAGDGRLAVVEGPAGIGKTRLLQAIPEHAGDAFEARVLAARGAPFGIHIAAAHWRDHYLRASQS